MPLIRPYRNPEGVSALHLYVVQLDPERTNKSRAEVFASLREQGIGRECTLYADPPAALLS